MTTVTTDQITNEVDGAPALIVGMGLLLGLSGIVHGLTGPFDTLLAGLEVAVSATVGAGLVYGGYWLISRRTSESVRQRALTWVSGGVIVAAVITGWILAFARLGGGQINGPLSLVSTLVAAGGAAGFAAALQTAPTADTCDCSRQEPSTETQTQPETWAATPTTELGPEATAVLDALADDRSRATVALLFGGEDADDRSVDAIAEGIADRFDEDPDTAAISLRHATLPRLEAAGILTWDRSADRVTSVDETAVEMGAQELGAAVASFESTGTRL